MEFVTFKHGPTLPLSAWLLAIDLDLRRLRLSADGQTLRVIGPSGKPELSESERLAITQWKPHLLALVSYCEANH